MNEYKVYIEVKGWEDSTYIHVARTVDVNTREYLTMDNGLVVAHTISHCEPIPEDSHFLKLPFEIYNAIETGIIKRVEQRGGVETAQVLRGENRELQNEVKWFRDTFRDTIGSLLFK